jgi:hypothetical protein
MSKDLWIDPQAVYSVNRKLISTSPSLLLSSRFGQ